MGPRTTDVPAIEHAHQGEVAERSRPPDSTADIDVDDRLAPLAGALHQFTLERLELLGYLTLVRNVFLAQANAAKYQQAEFVRAYADQTLDQFGGLLHMIDSQDAGPDADEAGAALWPDWMDSTAVATAFKTDELHDACDLTRDAIAIGREVSDLDDPKLPADYEVDHLLAHALALCGHVQGAYKFPAPNPVVDEWHQRLATLDENKLKTLGGSTATPRAHAQKRNRRK